MPGNQGGSNWGSTAGQSWRWARVRHRLQRADDHPLAANPARSVRRGAATPEEIVREGYPVTDGFGLFPTIVKPPYTTLTAYDLNTGTIAWQKGLGDDLRLRRTGHHRHGIGGDGQGRD